ncbi:hypothetical protein Tco_0587866 [Tanacetum coccineum]
MMDGDLQDKNTSNGGVIGQVHEVTNDGIPNEAGFESVMKEAPTSYANKLSPTSLIKANIQKLDANVLNDADFDIWLPLALVHEFSSTKGVDSVLRDGPWMILGVPILVDKDKGGSSRVDDGFIKVKKKKSGGNNGGTKNFKPISVKPKTIYHPKVNQPNEESSPKMAPSGDNKKVSTTGNSSKKTGKIYASTSAGKCVLLNDEGKPLEKIDYTGVHDSEDEVEPIANEMASFLASKPSGVGYGSNSLLEQ